MGDPGSAARYERARIFLRQGRYREAADAFKLLLADDPEDVGALCSLAVCLYRDEGSERAKEALEVVDRALAVEPEMQAAHSLRASILGDLKRFEEAHEAASRAIALDPESSQGYAAEAQIWVSEERWAKAAEWARRGLEQDPDDGQCSALLSHALLMMGDAEGHREEVAYRLSRDPENPYTHSNMGYAALRAGDHRAATRHFAEALRLDPSFESARAGMIESFRARSPLYRAYLAYGFWMAKMPPAWRTGLMIGLFIVYRIAAKSAEGAAPRVAVGLVAAWMAFALFTFLSRGVGTLIVLFDRFARMALKPREMWEGVVVGGLAVAGLVGVVTGLLLGSDTVSLVSACVLAPSVPLSVAFQADQAAGRAIYGSLGGVVAFCGLVVALGLLRGLALESLMVAPFFAIGVLVFVATSWMASFGVKTD